MSYPPPYQSYPPPQGGYPPPQGGYPPPPGYPSPQGYAAPNAPSYPAPAPGYGAPQPQYQQQPGVVVVGAPQYAPTTTIIRERRSVNHALHCIITFFFFPWVIVWIILCITEG